MFEFPEKLTYGHFEQMFDLEKTFYDEEFITPAAEAWRWYELHPHSVTVAMHGEELAGFVNLFPVRQDLYDAIAAGEFNDSNLKAKDIVPLDELTDSAQACQMFLSCIVVGVEHRGKGLTQALVQAAAKQYIQYASQLECIVVDTVTGDGTRFAERLGFQFVCESDHDTRAYAQHFSSFLKHVL